MKRFYDANPPYIVADADKVLCDGFSMTGLGGRVTNQDTTVLDTWQEMTEAEAEALCSTEEATEADYQAALSELGVTFNEEI